MARDGRGPQVIWEMSDYEIACALNERHGRRWKIVPTDDFVFDQRLIDPRVPISPAVKSKIPTA